MVSVQKLVEKACRLDNIDVAEAVQWKHMNRVNRERQKEKEKARGNKGEDRGWERGWFEHKKFEKQMTTSEVGRVR